MEDHTCIQSRALKACTSRFLADHVIKSLATNPDIPVRAVQDQMQKQFEVGVSKMKAFREKRIAYDIMTGRALKQGFRTCGREILGLDGGFMSGPWPGQILTAVGVDANNMIYLVAYAIVEEESKRYIYKPLQVCFQVLNTAKATSEGEFKKKMGELKPFNSNAYDWLMKIPLEQWSRAYFSGRAKCDLLINNICEVINRQLVDGREYLMKRIVATEYNVQWNGGFLYQVIRPYKDQYVVNMDRRVCSCRKWELTEIPCKHAVAAIYNMYENSAGVGIPEQWVHAAYRLETWAHVYSFKVNPCNGRDMWPVVESRTVIIPPLYKPLIGRPPKKRKKSNDDIASQSASSGKLSRNGKSVICGKCSNVGHNRKGCKGQGGISSQAAARKVSGQAASSRKVSGQAASARNVSGQAAGARKA
ncbi:mutator type transposase [Tanacetum coccineum]